MKNNDWHDLIQKQLDGIANPEESAKLKQALENDAELRAVYLDYANLDMALESSVKADVALQEAQLVPGQFPNVIIDWFSSRTLFFGIVIGILTSSMLWVLSGATNPITWLRDETPTENKYGIARVIRIEGDGTAGEDRIVVDDSELFAGEELAMQQGLIELAFRETGVHVIAAAPLKMQLNSNERLSLHEGQVKLVVPPQGVGFVVETGQRKFVDLGTSFVVTANANGSEVLVLDGQISVDENDGTADEVMHEGEFAKFDQNGKIDVRRPVRMSLALPELSLQATKPDDSSLRGVVLGYGNTAAITKDKLDHDVIGLELLPLIQSGFQDRAPLEDFKHGEPISFRGIAGAYHEFPNHTGLVPYLPECGWVVWYHGQVLPPRPGRYRFWGYADNHLLVAIDGKPVFEGSRDNSAFKTLNIPRTNNPSLPCLIAKAGFACGPWVELSGDPTQLDMLFGEVGGNVTSGLLLIEREGDTYDETFWGQPKWPLFLTEVPGEQEVNEFERLVKHLEEKTMGSFSISAGAVWKTAR